MRVKIGKLAALGIVTGSPAQELPPNAFTGGQNVRFLDGEVKKFAGHQQVFGTNPIVPYYTFPFANSAAYYWVVCGATKVYITDGTTWTNITRQNGGVDEDYVATLTGGWNGGILGGSIPILNNGLDYPQQWSPAQASQRLANLKYDASRTWADVAYTAKAMRTFKNFVVAMDVTKSGTRYSNLVKWSSSADPGSVPDTWDESDTAYDSGESVVTEAGGDLIDGLPLRDNFVIYAEDACHVMQYVGGNYVFRFSRLFEDGILSRRCVKSSKGYHVVLSANDLIIHDGNTVRSIVDKKMRSWLFNNIDPDYYQRCFITPNYRKNEMWICFPQIGSTLPDMALVWNYQDDTFGVRELPDTPHIGYGVIDPGTSTIIDDVTTIIDLNTGIIDERTYNPTIYYPLILGTNLYQGDTTEQFAGTSFTSYIERTSLDFGEPDKYKHVSRLIPTMTGSGAVTIGVGSQNYIGESTNWSYHTFTPGADWKVDTRKSGRYISYRVESTGNITWALSSIDFEVTIDGER